MKGLGLLQVFLLSGLSFLFGQKQATIPEEIKTLLFSSVESDGNNPHELKIEDWLRIARNHYEFLEIEVSPEATLYKPGVRDTGRNWYKVRLYKVICENSENQSRYVLFFQDFSSKVMLRVAGYVENDIHLLLEYLSYDGVTFRMWYKIISDWNSSDPLFNEIDWGCILEGAKRRKANSDCFISAYYVLRNDLCVNCELLKKNQMNSNFSKLPLWGRFERF